jgi:hypothetical protein
MWHVTDERPAADEDRALQDRMRALTDEWPGAELLLAQEADCRPG